MVDTQVDLAFHHSPLDGIRGVAAKAPDEETPICPTHGRGASHSSIRKEESRPRRSMDEYLVVRYMTEECQEWRPLSEVETYRNHKQPTQEGWDTAPNILRGTSNYLHLLIENRLICSYRLC